MYLGTTVGASIINLNNFLNQYDKNNGIDGYVRGKIDRVKGEIYFASSKDMYSIKPSYDPMINNSIKDLEFNK